MGVECAGLAASFLVVAAGSTSALAAEVMEASKVGVTLPRAVRFAEAASLAAAKSIADPKISLRIYDAPKEDFQALVASLEKSTGVKPSLGSRREGDDVVEQATWSLAQAEYPWMATHWMYVEKWTRVPLDAGAALGGAPTGKPGKPKITVAVYRKEWPRAQPQTPARVEQPPAVSGTGSVAAPATNAGGASPPLTPIPGQGGDARVNPEKR